MFVLNHVKLSPHLYQLTLKPIYIQRILRSLYTIYNIRYRTVSCSPHLWRATLLPYPDIREMCDKHLFHALFLLYLLSTAINLYLVRGNINDLPILLFLSMVNQYKVSASASPPTSVARVL